MFILVILSDLIHVIYAIVKCTYIYLIYNVQVLQLKSITCRKNKFSNIIMDT